MNREIKFRAWDKLQNKMINAEPFSEEIAIQLGGVIGLFNGKTYDTVTDEFILMQYTGLHDKNGKEIYEGDLIKHEDGHLCEITFEKGGFHMTYRKGIEKGITRRISHSAQYSEVIGNIYQNPELL